MFFCLIMFYPKPDHINNTPLHHVKKYLFTYTLTFFLRQLSYINFWWSWSLKDSNEWKKNLNLFAVISWYSLASTVAKCQEIDYLLLWKLLVAAPAATEVVLLYAAVTAVVVAAPNADEEDFFVHNIQILKCFVGGRFNAFSYERSKQPMKKHPLNCVPWVLQNLKLTSDNVVRLQHVGQVKRVVATCF